jgi:hypothetical protein
MGESDADFYVWPTVRESLDCFALGNVQRVAVCRIYFSERLNQIGNVTLVSGQTGTNRVCINRYVQTDVRS